MSDSETLLAFKAGRAFRRGTSNFVEPNPTKGAIILKKEDDLLHFQWKNRTTDQIEEDLILFPSDASFSKVSQASGRVYVLKFSSSDQRHFFWMQDASSARDEEFVNEVNAFLVDPDHAATWSSPSQPQASTSGASSAAPSTFQATPEQLAQLQQLLSNAVAGGTSTSALPEMSLNDILTSVNITPLFTSHPELVSTLFPHLPPDLPMPPSAEVVERIISSPQFRSAVSNLDQALRTGLLGGLVRGLGLPEEAGLGIEPFLRAIQRQAEEERGEDSMDTD